jgi:transcriptional regulator with XRE-family HTH domain
MKRKTINARVQPNQGTPSFDKRQPLLRALLAQAEQRRDTRHMLAQKLGVTYSRLSQWRRREGDFASASLEVMEKAASYLGIPTILALVMGGRIGLEQFSWPAKQSLSVRIGLELERMRLDPFLGPFMPVDLAAASESLQLFVVFLYHQLASPPGTEERNFRWLRTLHQAAQGDLQARVDLETLRTQSADKNGTF